MRAAAALLAAALAGCASHGPVERDVSSEFDAVRVEDAVGNETIVSYRVGETGPTVVFLHGIPASSYLWRNVLPIVGREARAVAADLPGYGESSVPAPAGAGEPYGWRTLYEPLEAWLDARPERDFVLVVNDLGSVLGLRYFAERPERVAGIVLAEAVFMPAEPWHDQLTGLQRAMFAMMRADWLAERMIVTVPRLQSMIWDMAALRTLTDAERARYLAPYADPERREALRHGPGPATFPKGGRSTSPDDLAALMDANAAALDAADVPILLLTADPGFIVGPEAIAWARERFARLTVGDVGASKHFLPEDRPTAVGEAIRDWVATLAIDPGPVR